MQLQKNLNLIIGWLFCLLPISFVFSTFISNFSIIIISIFGIFCLIKNKNYKIFLNFYTVCFIFFYLFISINSILSNYIDFKSIKSSIFFIRYLFLIIGIYYLYKFNSKIFNEFFNIYLVLLILLFLDSNYQYLNDGKNIFGVDSYQYQNERISSFFFDELVLGSYVQKFAILFTCFFFLKKSFYERLIPIVLIISIEICFISGERLAFFTLLIFIIVYYFFFLRISILYKFISILCLSLISISFINYNPSLKSRIFTNTFESIKSSNFKYFSPGHKEHLDIALKMYQDKPIFGHGSNKFRVQCQEYENKYNINGCSTHPHNIIAQFLSEQGSTGIIFLSIFYTILIFNIIKNLSSKNNLKKENNLLLLISILLFFNPFFPSANFFNSWVNNIIYIIFSYFFFQKKNKIYFNFQK